MGALGEKCTNTNMGIQIRGQGKSHGECDIYVGPNRIVGADQRQAKNRGTQS